MICTVTIHACLAEERTADTEISRRLSFGESDLEGGRVRHDDSLHDHCGCLMITGEYTSTVRVEQYGKNCSFFGEVFPITCGGFGLKKFMDGFT
jgi:hypothetical protein